MNRGGNWRRPAARRATEAKYGAPPTLILHTRSQETETVHLVLGLQGGRERNVPEVPKDEARRLIALWNDRDVLEHEPHATIYVGANHPDGRVEAIRLHAITSIGAEAATGTTWSIDQVRDFHRSTSPKE